jgi:ubiquinol-cytochrome c reductase iron-sulfur subunit
LIASANPFLFYILSKLLTFDLFSFMLRSLVICKGFKACRHLASLVPQPSGTKIPIDQLGSVDHGFDDDRINKVAEPERRAFVYMVLTGARFVYAAAVRVIAFRIAGSISPSAEVLALAFTEFDTNEIELGTTVCITWRGKPVYIRKRTAEEIEMEENVPMEHLRDQELDVDRRIRPEIMVVLGICPHLGCVPLPDQGEFGGFLCPCHGSHYDYSGRIRKGPAPLNLEVPPYKFIEGDTLLLG